MVLKSQKCHTGCTGVVLSLNWAKNAGLWLLLKCIQLQALVIRSRRQTLRGGWTLVCYCCLAVLSAVSQDVS